MFGKRYVLSKDLESMVIGESISGSTNAKNAFEHELKPRLKIKVDKVLNEIEEFLYEVSQLKIPDNLNYSIMRYRGTKETDQEFADSLVEEGYKWLQSMKDMVK